MEQPRPPFHQAQGDMWSIPLTSNVSTVGIDEVWYSTVSQQSQSVYDANSTIPCEQQLSRVSSITAAEATSASGIPVQTEYFMVPYYPYRSASFSQSLSTRSEIDLTSSCIPVRSTVMLNPPKSCLSPPLASQTSVPLPLHPAPSAPMSPEHSKSSRTGSGRRINPACGDFVNFTLQDGNKILAAVAPSGSSKTKLRRKKRAMEQRRKLTEAVRKAVQKAGGDLAIIDREALLMIAGDTEEL
jgi:hypothetical protein